MNEPEKIKGIVVKSAQSGDNDRMLSVLTAEKGLISVSAKGVKSLKNKNSQGVMPLCYSELVLKEKGDIYSLASADAVESFYALREDMTALSYGVYFAQLAAFTVGKNNACPDEMRLLLNTLFLLSKAPERCFVLCCVFEVKICEYAGFAPYIDACSCGNEGAFFDTQTGECVCAMHRTATSKPISNSAKTVIEYVQNADLKEALLFDTPKEVAEEISGLIQAFLTCQLGRLPKSLDYIKKIII